MSEGEGDMDVELTHEELVVFAEGVKFASCVPTDLLCRTVGTRLFVVKLDRLHSVLVKA